MTGRPRLTFILTAPMLIASAAAGCSGDGGTGTETFESWQLVTIDNNPVPVRILATGSYTEYVDSAHIEFRRYSRLLDVQHRRRVYSFTPDTTRFSDSASFAYSLQGDTIIVHRPAFIPSDDWADTGTYSPDQLSLRVRRSASGGYVHDEWQYSPLVAAFSRHR